MPFCKRLVAPKDVCRRRTEGAAVGCLRDACGFALHAVLRQLSDLCRHAASIVDELDGELASVCERSRSLQRKVGGLQKRVSAAAALGEPPPPPPLLPKTATNSEPESKRTAHFRSSWQQHANVFSPWSRPECVRELHEEAQLNLHRLLQEFEEQLYEDKATGQTFRPAGQPSSPSSADAGRSSSQRPDFVFLAHDGGAVPVGFPASDPDGGSPGRPQLRSRSSRGPPVAEKPRWHPRCRAPARLPPADVTGHLSAPEETLGFDLIQSVHSTEPLGPGLSMPSSETRSHHVPLRKTCSDLGEGTMEHAGPVCANPSWNGPKGSTFCPSSWNDSFSSFGLVADPVANAASPEHATGTFDSPVEGSSDHSVSSGLHSSSFLSVPTQSSAKTPNSPPPEAGSTRGVAEGPAKSAAEKEERRSSRAGALKFRERSLSTPTDSDSLCSADNQSATEMQPECESYAPRYASESSEEGTSVHSMSATASDFTPDGRPRSRSRSISLKKPKKKPPPPVRSVSLKNGLSAEVTLRDGRPKSLIITSEHLQDFQPDFMMGSKQLQNMKEFSLSNRRRASDTQAFNIQVSSLLSECKLTDPVTSTGSSTMAKFAARSENEKACGQAECPASSSASQATSYSSPSTQAESKKSPVKAAGPMSPSSGYSSQSETPTPTVPTSMIMGPSPLGCKVRPKIPERKSSLPAPSPGNRATRSRLSIELPVTSQLDFSSIKPKPKASRRHSDSSAANEPGRKLSPSQSTMPLVTQTDLQNVRLRSISRSEPEDRTDSSSDIIAKDKRPVAAPTVTPNPKVKPPVSVKPPLPKRPPNLNLKSPSVPPSSECPPATSRELPKPVEDIYRVVKKPRPKKQPQSALRSGSVEEAGQRVQQQNADNQQVPDHRAQSVSSGTEPQSYNRALPTRVTVSSLAELDRKWKVPPPVPKKPNIMFLPVSAFPSSVSPAGRLANPPGSTSVPTCPAVSGRDESCTADGVSPPDPEQQHHLHAGQAATANLLDDSGDRSSEDVDHERSTLSATDEDYDDVFVQSSAPHTTEDLFTIIHRSKRKVLGRKEPADHFGSRQSLTSPVKSSGDTRAVALASTPRSSSRNDNFMALLQRKNSKPNGAGRVSAMELLKSTNPLARRVTEFAPTEPEAAGRSGPLHDH